MNDIEMLGWIAEHMVSFAPMPTSVTMVYIDDDGYEKKVRCDDFATFNPSCLEQLRACVKKATATK